MERKVSIRTSDQPSSPSKPWWRRWFGDRSERAVASFLKKDGHKILKRNYRCPLGELDLITLDGDCLVFVEVRSTEGKDTDRPALSVDHAKQQRLTRLAIHFQKKYCLLGRQARFDIVAVSWPSDKKDPTIAHYPHAFEAVGRFQMFQ